MNNYLREFYFDLKQLPIELVSELEGGLVCLSMIPDTSTKSFILKSFLSYITLPAEYGATKQYWPEFMHAVKSNFEKGIGWTPRFAESHDQSLDLGSSWAAGFIDVGAQIGVEWQSLIMNPVNGTTLLPLLVWIEDSRGNAVTASNRMDLSALRQDSIEQIPNTLQWIYDSIN